MSHASDQFNEAVEHAVATDDGRPTSRLAGIAHVLWHSGRRLAVVIAGFALVAAGVAMLVLPGPGLLVIIAGLALLAREFVWADRLLQSAKARAASGADAARRLMRRRRAER
jgi:uncharacterized protein (TIGR02611 family)